MAISKENIKKLRNQTSCGIADCKKALTEADGDYDKAIEILKERGLAKSLKKAGREASEGKVFVAEKDNKALLIEVNCETDFVGNTDDFNEFGNKAVQMLLEKNIESKENIPQEVETLRNDYVLKLNENLVINRMLKLEGDKKNPVISFIQMGKDGALMKFNFDKEIEISKELAEDLEDILITASFYKPSFKTFEDVDENAKNDKKEEILKEIKEDPKFANKPENILENIVGGKLKKAFVEECLYELPFYKESSKKISTLLKEVSKKHDVKVDVDEYGFIKIGE